LAKLLEDDVVEDDANRNALIRAIRTHVSDMWRLHRRILRSRRNEQTSVYLPGRGGAKRILYDCENERGLAEAVEAWRLLHSLGSNNASESASIIAVELARVMEEFASCEPQLVLKMAKRRRDLVDFDGLPHLDGEVTLLDKIINAASECNQDVKLHALLREIQTYKTSSSFVVFTTAKITANLVFEFLKKELPQRLVFRHSLSDLAWTQFTDECSSCILVCDRTAEEGINLQKQDAVAVHYDLPFAPNRIEQRIGRLDRFGCGVPVVSIAMVAEGSQVQMNWFEFLDIALDVFVRSIASLQYLIEESMRSIWNNFIHSGCEAFDEATEILGGSDGKVATEFKRIRAQDAIDAYEIDPITQNTADELEFSDGVLSRTAVSVFKNWVISSIQFRYVEDLNGTFRYQFAREGSGPKTLLPVDEYQRLFFNSIDTTSDSRRTKNATVPFSFNRIIAQRRNCRLLRVGDPFVDAFEHYARWDDRGACFAFWRHCPAYKPTDDPDVFFRFDYVLSPNPEPLLELCNGTTGANVNSMLRRSRAVMEP
ncbi:MAG: hypothetical protein LC687_02825, partial [Actinobacteria bacterium]|nr:hypothetical protein [Actinomycetota bacterium]